MNSDYVLDGMVGMKIQGCLNRFVSNVLCRTWIRSSGTWFGTQFSVSRNRLLLAFQSGRHGRIFTPMMMQPRSLLTKPIPQQISTSSSHQHRNQPLYQATRRKGWGVKHVRKFFIIGDIIILLIYSLRGLALVDVPRRSTYWLERSPRCAGIWHQSIRFVYHSECWIYAC